mgnify:CR=1 FL=1|tara:strand:- start:277 stop:540 length:264 start_codon:yes stop_codon:yes gene_type:complete
MLPIDLTKPMESGDSTEFNVEWNYQLHEQSKHIEVIHQFTAHDIENTIAEIKQINFSPEHPKYDEFVQSHIEKNFILQRNNKTIKMK